MGEILSIFEGGDAKAAQAMSEPFLKPDDFIAVKHEAAPRISESELMGIATAYVDDIRDGVAKVDYVLLLDPHHKFGKKPSVVAFVDGYNDSAGAAIAMADELRDEGNLDPGIEGYVEAGAVFIPYSAGLLTVASVAVFGTPEDHSGELIVPKRTIDEIALSLRETALEGVLSGESEQEIEGVDPEHVDEAMRAVRSQHSVMQNFGIIGAVNHLRKIDIIPKLAEAQSR